MSMHGQTVSTTPEHGDSTHSADSAHAELSKRLATIRPWFYGLVVYATPQLVYPPFWSGLPTILLLLGFISASTSYWSPWHRCRLAASPGPRPPTADDGEPQKERKPADIRCQSCEAPGRAINALDATMDAGGRVGPQPLVFFVLALASAFDWWMQSGWGVRGLNPLIPLLDPGVQVHAA